MNCLCQKIGGYKMVKFMNQMVKGLGPTKFTAIYAVLFTSLINSIATAVNVIMKNPPWTTSQVLINVIMYFVIGLFLGRQIVKKSGC